MEIITDEFIQYKSGFIAAKNEIVEAFKLGKIINFDSIEPEKEDTWYFFGYQDGFNYFANLIDNLSLNLEQINTKEITSQCFSKRVLEINKEQNKEIPISKFRI